MANKKFLLAILAIVLVFGMAVSGCSKGPKPGGGSGSGEADGGGGEPSKLTIAGLPEGKYDLLVVSANTNLSSYTNVASAGFGFEAGGMQTSGNVFELLLQGGDPWTGTGKRQVILASKNYNKDAPLDKNNPMFRTATVNFSRGGATVKFSDFTAVTK
jgi:hypothetical protein